jgi:hypothetical protein
MATTQQKSAPDRLADIWKQWGMGQSLTVEDAKTQKLALGGLIDALKDAPSLTVRSMQALLVDPERPGASDRPLFELLWHAVRVHWDAAGTGNPADVLRLQALLLAAWDEQPESAAFDLIPALLSPWRHLNGRKTQQPTLGKWLAECQRDEQAEYAEEVKSGDPSALVTDLAKLSKQRIFTGDASDQHNVTPVDNPATQVPVVAAVFGQRTQNYVIAMVRVMNRLAALTGATRVHRTLDSHELLWWGQALYCYSLRRPFRRIEDPDEVAWCAAVEAANRASDLPVEPAASYLQEVLRNAGVVIDEKRSVWQHACALRDVLHRTQAERNEVPEDLAELITEDAFGLPVSLLCVEPTVADDKLRESLGVEADQTMIDRGEWAAWVFRELILQRRWPAPEPTP